MSSQEKQKKSVFSVVREWYRNRREESATQPRPEQSIAGAGERPPMCSGLEPPAPPRCFFDASLLFRCMEMLEIDRGELAKDDPLLFHELQGVCALCRSKQECSQDLGQDLGQEFDDARWHKWWVYCPNSAMLGQIGAVHAATRAAPNDAGFGHSPPAQA